MPDHDLDETISEAEALVLIQDACLFANDNAGIKAATRVSDRLLAVAMYRGCDTTEMGRLQYFTVTVERLPTIGIP